ncbi:hypothetical protein ACFVFQ_19585 [Streptomyces sp. NPDC057743]|uniref:hypothetical protein n=1 Tax=Streptomyces sp. NPDC057743 TaxID=3346236 RepID=UPI0036767AD2
MPEMPEVPDRGPAASGDYLGRLLARYAPAAPAPDDPFGPPVAAGPGRPTLVRPRLPGPFERVTALPGPTDGEPADDGPSIPRATGWPAPAPYAGQLPRAERRTEIRTRAERETVLRTEAASEADRGPAAERSGPAPLLRPAAAAAPGARAAGEGGRPRGRAGAAGPVDTAAGRGGDPARVPTDSGAPAGALRPRTDAVPAPRHPVPSRGQAPVGRRAARGPAERVVHVQIGRLEVSTSGAAGTGRPAAGGRPARPERRAPALSLGDYLASQQRTSGGRST